MAIKQMGTASDGDENSSKLQDIKETMQQSNSEISELKRKLNELELLAASKLKKKQEMVETAHKQLREETNEKELLYEKVCSFFLNMYLVSTNADTKYNNITGCNINVILSGHCIEIHSKSEFAKSLAIEITQ